MITGELNFPYWHQAHKTYKKPSGSVLFRQTAVSFTFENK